MALATAALSPSVLFAGGVDRSGQGINLIFEPGTVIQAGLSWTSPRISGSIAADAPNNATGEYRPSGNVARNFWIPQGGYKTAINDQIDVALIYDEPYGADILYPVKWPFSGETGGNTQQLSAKAKAESLTGILRYKFDNGFSAIGGIRAQRLHADVRVPGIPAPGVDMYNINTDKPIDFGYVVGVAWEKPEIAARVSLTYNSAIKHDLDQTETTSALDVKSTSEVKSPQSVNLDFQTGVAADTLVFGRIRWVDWRQLVWNAPVYDSIFQEPIVKFGGSTTTYTLGVARQITPEFAGAIEIQYEDALDTIQTDLGPNDGFWAIGIGGTYDFGDTKLSGGIQYTDVGDATTDIGGKFKNNHAWSVGIQVTHYLNKN
ncbi:outer membrane protein transport protein [Ruegeria sp. 2012CJ41-6]|uniref:Outer membrane protein transport protein n=1 Tax=Ruegeria spongiae TaxID=2942209 RepID=A0ABT0PYH4_9RHOB|nr:outer membrane protein transport protein [Ruegeria spongiae]MCL6281968.1 outer membrane protein transport protein [Ruegeria spongiae]